MSIVLYSRAAPSNCLRVWVGSFQATQAPRLSWYLNGNPTAPIGLRQISSVRPVNLLPAGIEPESVPRAFCGVYEFVNLKPDTAYVVSVEGDGEKTTLETRTLPNQVPAQLDRWFNVLLVSCFHQAEDRGGLAGKIVSQFRGPAQPHLTVLAGDQVYLDLPTLKDFPDDPAWLADKFEKDYTVNWRGPLAYTQVLAAAPSISIPDDHEYWNNYPHPSPFIANSRTATGRENWRRAAQAVYEGFQLPYPIKLGDSTTIEVEPLSFFFADTRTNKSEERKFTLTVAEREKLDSWVTSVIERKLFGVFFSGQSLFMNPTGKFTGPIGDYEIPNYGDYGSIMSSLRRLIDAGRPTLCLTGDVHWGRVVTTRDIRTGRTAFTEVISSPASLVSTLVFDQVKQLSSFLGSLFEPKEPWPRHANPASPPAFLAAAVLDKRFPCTMVHGQRGNHVVMLSFRQQGSGLELRVKYWPITCDSQIGKPIEIGPVELFSG